MYYCIITYQIEMNLRRWTIGFLIYISQPGHTGMPILMMCRTWISFVNTPDPNSKPIPIVQAITTPITKASCEISTFRWLIYHRQTENDSFSFLTHKPATPELQLLALLHDPLQQTHMPALPVEFQNNYVPHNFAR